MARGEQGVPAQAVLPGQTVLPAQLLPSPPGSAVRLLEILRVAISEWKRLM